MRTVITTAQPFSPPPTPPTAAEEGPLTDGHYQAIVNASLRARKIIAARRFAAFNAWSSAIFALFCLPFAFFNDTALIMGIGLSFVAWNEFRGRRLLGQLQMRSTRVLGWNQLIFMFLLIGYSFWSISISLRGSNPYEQHIALNPELEQMLGPISQLHAFLTLAVYGAVILLSIIFQGGGALFYFGRSRHLEAYLAQTEPWIIELHRRLLPG